MYTVLALMVAVPAPTAERALKVPPGYEVRRVADSALVDRPITADFDEQGRLYVADSSGSNENVQKQLANPTHRILRLEDTDGDGTFDKVTVFADKLMFPAGTMWYAGSLYVSAPPHILKLTDTDGDGVADRREIWYDGKTLTGCANDLHGPYLGPDGFIYWAKGAFAEQTHGGVRSKAAHILRARPDGSRREAVMTGGMDNPVDVVFTPGGERLFNCTFLQHPADGKRDGLIHAVYGGLYGKDHAPVRDHKHTSPHLLPPMTHLGPAAPSGLHLMQSDALGFAGQLFCTQFNLRKVSRHELKPSGSTFTTIDRDFVTCDDLDFHPTDVLEDADGSLVVIDTGGWYKLCCPSSQLVKADVRGGIYRVRKVGAPAVDDPRGRRIEAFAGTTPGPVLMYFDDPRPAVRRRAVEWFAAQGEAAVKPLANFPALGGGNGHDYATLAALNALTRIDTPTARRAIREHYLKHPVPVVRLAGIHAVSLWKDADAAADLRPILRSGSLPEKRAAAEALGRLADAAAVPNLVAALADDATDAVLEHSLTFALLEIGDAAAMRNLLAHTAARVRCAALMVLEQTPAAQLPAKPVLECLRDSDARVRETAWWIAARHPEWAGELAETLRTQFCIAASWPPEAREELLVRTLAFAKTPTVQALLADVARTDAAPLALQAMARSGLKAMPPAWEVALAPRLREPTPAAKEALAVVRAVPAANFAKLVPAWPNAGDEMRLLRAAAGGATDVAFLLRKLGKAEPPEFRALAVEALARGPLAAPDLVALAAALPTVGPLDLPRLLPAFAQSTDATAGRAFVAALLDARVRPTVRLEQVKPILDRYAGIEADARTLYAALDADKAGMRTKLEAIFAELKNGDVRRGQAVFNSPKAACAACHQIGYVGGKIGPDLTRIGGIRSERDLLEAVVFPSASFVRNYEPLSVQLFDGQTFNGVLKGETAEEIALTLAVDKQVRIARKDIQEMKPGTVSIMPAGLEQQISRQDLADLIAFLKASK